MRRAAFILLALGGAACGLSVVGVDDGTSTDGGAGGGLPDGAPSPRAPGMLEDAASSTDAFVAPPPCVGDACSPLVAPAPFRTVLYGDRAAACPTGFGVADVVTNPVAKAGACACGACVTSATCTTGNVGTRYSSDTQCNGSGGNISANNGACFAYNGYFISNYASIIPPAAVAGACSAPGAGVPANVGADPKRICAPQVDSCADILCTPPGGMKTCLEAPGDVACPASAPAKTLVGADVDVTCAACTCTTTATCGGAVTFYAGSNCTGGTKVLQAGVCTQVNGASIQSTRYEPVVNKQCTNVVPGAPSVGLKGSRTVCCP